MQALSQLSYTPTRRANYTQRVWSLQTLVGQGVIENLSTPTRPNRPVTLHVPPLV